ncbi:MAG: hypothetical protein J6D04_00640 [Clostridia bacterium]|nr:hypothetical protein [Clostridia bacterium]
MNRAEEKDSAKVQELLETGEGKQLKKLIDNGDLARFQGRFTETEIENAFQKIIANPELRDLLQKNSGIVESIIEFLKR